MKFSFVIISHNQKETIFDAIDSVLNQTYADVEAIFVDDASSDGTVELVKSRYSDERLHVIACEENQGPLLSRMSGIEASSGDWILFLDGDDEYALNTCEVLYNAIIRSKSVDMVGFGVDLIVKKPVSNFAMTDLKEKLNRPHLGYLSNEELMASLFLNKTMSWNIANKAYSSKILKEVHTIIIPDKLYSAEDFYMNFIACSLVKSYLGIENRLYRYSIGLGISTSLSLSLDRYLRFLTGIRSVRYTTKYAKAVGIYEKYSPCFFEHEKDCLYASYEKLTRLAEDDVYLASKKMLEEFGLRNALNGMSLCFSHIGTEVAKCFDIKQLFPKEKKSIKTIGMLYYRMYNGGIERVIQLLTPILQSAGYNVVVITDEEENELDYELPAGTPRVVLGPPTNDIDVNKGYGLRYDRLTNCIKEHNIDAVICHAWVSDSLLWDMCTIKSTGAACIVHCHGVFSTGLNNGWVRSFNSNSIFRHADALIALTEVDQFHWSAYNPNSFNVINPMTFDPAVLPQSSLTTQNIIWIGRFDPGQKNPMDALHIMHEVVQYLPDAKLYMVGSGDPEYVERMIGEARALNIEKNVILPGFTKNVEEYYLNASVLLFTSNFEGFGMVFAEALSYGVPCVTYTLPYIPMIHNSAASISVQWKDIGGAAKAIIKILTDDTLRKKMGNQAKKEALALKEIDYVNMWKSIISDIERDTLSNPITINDELLQSYRNSIELTITQMANNIQSLYYQVKNPPIAPSTLDYKNLSRPMRWLAYLLFDRQTLKSIVKYKNRSRPVRLKLYKKIWGFMRSIRRVFMTRF